MDHRCDSAWNALARWRKDALQRTKDRTKEILGEFLRLQNKMKESHLVVQILGLPHGPPRKLTIFYRKNVGEAYDLGVRIVFLYSPSFPIVPCASQL